MKLKLIILLLGAVTLSSCSKVTVVNENHGAPIGFRTSLFNPLKADANVTTASTINEFKVYAFEETATDVLNSSPIANLNGAIVSKVGENWTYSPLANWPSVNQVDFWAYSPAASANPTMTSYERKLECTIPTLASSQNDLLAAYAEGTRPTSAASGVALNFKHILSQIVVNAKVGSGLTIKVKAVKICNVNSAGTFTMPAIGETSFSPEPADWSTNTPASFEIGENIPITLSSSAQSVQGDYNFMLLPQAIESWNNEGLGTSGDNNGKVYMAFQVNIMNGAVHIYPDDDSYAWTAVPVPAINWQPAKKYTYTVTFDSGADGSLGSYEPNVATNGGNPIYGAAPIVFSAPIVTDWVNAADQNINS